MDGRQVGEDTNGTKKDGANLPSNWGLLTLGITMAVLGILETSFIDNEIIIIEGASIWTQFMYNTLQVMYGDKMVMVNNISSATEWNSLQIFSTRDKSLGDGPSQMDKRVPRDRRERIVRSSNKSLNEEERVQMNE